MEKEEKQYGKYRTRRLVLETWDNLETKWLFAIIFLSGIK